MYFELKRLILALALPFAALSGIAGATPSYAADIALPPSTPFPESVSVTSEGTLFVSSISHGGILRFASPDAQPSLFLNPGDYGTRSTFGVLADEKTGTLWVASNDASAIGLKGPSTTAGAWVKGFDLKSGALKVSIQLPATPAVANDFAIGKDGALYVTNTAGNQIFRLQPGGAQFEVFAQDDRLKGGLDGLAFGEDGALYVNTYLSGELFRIAVHNGKAGPVTKLETSRPLTHPDGLKPIKGGFLMVEGQGTLDRITIQGNRATVETVQPFKGPTGVTVSGNTVWVAEGQLSSLTALDKPDQTLPTFYLRSITLPQP